jgi:hypothetical protein
VKMGRTWREKQEVDGETRVLAVYVHPEALIQPLLDDIEVLVLSTSAPIGKHMTFQMQLTARLLRGR